VSGAGQWRCMFLQFRLWCVWVAVWNAVDDAFRDLLMFLGWHDSVAIVIVVGSCRRYS
jgi:hypothetical protein